ncbi:hypothetical protein GCM10020256_17850 [Streptomyces thermocoprophilus]
MSDRQRYEYDAVDIRRTDGAARAAALDGLVRDLASPDPTVRDDGAYLTAARRTPHLDVRELRDFGGRTGRAVHRSRRAGPHVRAAGPRPGRGGGGVVRAVVAGVRRLVSGGDGSAGLGPGTGLAACRGP